MRKTKKTRCSRGSGRSVHSSRMGKDEDEAAAYKAALGQLGRRTQDSMESQDRTGGRLMYGHFEDDDHE